MTGASPSRCRLLIPTETASERPSKHALMLGLDPAHELPAAAREITGSGVTVEGVENDQSVRGPDDLLFCIHERRLLVRDDAESR